MTLTRTINRAVLHILSLNFLRSTHLVVTDNEKRWLVAGIALFKVLIPQIRPFVEQEVDREYQRVKRRHNIHLQRRHRLRQLPSGVFLNYENINNNDVNFPKHRGEEWRYNAFDCKVLSHVDFSKLFLENFMTKKYSAFDEHCDASVILSLLGSVPVFSAAIQTAAPAVRDGLRNDWAHCVFSKWDIDKFQQVFADMAALVRGLGLRKADKEKLLEKLEDWQQKGKGTNSHVKS